MSALEVATEQATTHQGFVDTTIEKYDAAELAKDTLEGRINNFTDETEDAQAALDAVVELTTAAETAVDTQRGRVESLVAAQRTQD